MQKKRFIAIMFTSAGLFLALIWLMSGGIETAVHAANFTVNSTIDAVDANPGDGNCATGGGVCTLRAAIQEGNALAGTDLIILPAGTYTLTLTSGGSDTDAGGDLDITDDLIINGAGAATTEINGNQIDRVFYIGPGVQVQITGVTIKNGQSSFGAGISNSGNLTLGRSMVTGNQETGLFYAGAGIYNTGALTVTTSAIYANFLPNDGNGGGLFNQGQAVIENATFAGNTAGQGAGIYNSGSGNLQLNNITIAYNTGAVIDGGGGINSAGGDIDLSNSIIANNSSGGSLSDCQGTFVSFGHNLIQTTTGCTFSGTGTGDILRQTANLGELQDNGGATLTIALLAGSPAIDAGNSVSPGNGFPTCATTDQRGTIRPFDGDETGTAVCDIGAYELANWKYVYLPLVIK